MKNIDLTKEPFLYEMKLVWIDGVCYETKTYITKVVDNPVDWFIFLND